jgi:hypothetical protein
MYKVGAPRGQVAIPNDRVVKRMMVGRTDQKLNLGLKLQERGAISIITVQKERKTLYELCILEE